MRTPDDEVNNPIDELREHYAFDYTKAPPNRFADPLDDEAIMVVLEPEVAAAFPTPEAVNEALRLVMRLSRIPTAQTRRRRKRKAVGA
ncbi:MAG TPA: hypothetical protein PKE45_11060 [Caldilineaceae bacterium]|nr:hypothetical protein [Caldilineaceae bacterium]